MKRQWNILITGSQLDGVENSNSQNYENTMEHSDLWIMAGWRENSNSQNCEKAIDIQITGSCVDGATTVR